MTEYQRNEKAQKLLERGGDALVNGHDDLAFALFTEADELITEASSPDLFGRIQYLLGVCYFDEHGVKQDAYKALDVFPMRPRMEYWMQNVVWVYAITMEMV